MRYHILDVDLADVSTLPLMPAEPNEPEGLFVLLRFAGRPIGQLFLEADHRIGIAGNSIDEWISALPSDVRSALTRARVHNALGWSYAPPMSPNPQATVAVCTRERPDDLKRCLVGLAGLQGSAHEILVIDNDPRSDATRAIVADWSPHVRYIHENRRGLNAARNRALREARHEIVAFNDDDATPDANWLACLTRNFADPRVMCATGLVLPLELETPAQAIAERFCPFGRGFERQVFHGTAKDPLTASRVGAGASMAMRRSALELVGPFDEALDAGTPTQSGGDHEMFYRILSRGYSAVYDPEAVSWHRHRATYEAIRTALFGYGVGVYAFWTRCLLRERDWRVVPAALNWLLGYQLPGLVRSARSKPDTLPLSLAWAELQGCALGPWAYLRSCRHVSGTESASERISSANQSEEKQT